jgi:hypothetical protein
MEAMWDCASQVWVPGRLVGHVCRGVRISFLRHNSATIQFQVLMSMQMDAEFKKEQNDTFFVWVGALEGGVGGGSQVVLLPLPFVCTPISLKLAVCLCICRHVPLPAVAISSQL